MQLIAKLARNKSMTSPFVCAWLLIANYVIETCDGYISTIGVNHIPKAVPPGSPWPMPKIWKNSTTMMTINKDDFTFTGSIKGCDIVDSALKRYKTIIFPDDFTNQEDAFLPVLKGLHVEVTSKKCDFSPKFNMIESYNIKVSSNKIARVIAKNVWGALRGLATFSQLIWASPDNKVRINHTEIEDSPRFSHRGILVDTARHYIPVAVLLRNLDAMEFNKFNVLHWHIIDDQSFPYQSNTFPELHNQAAYSSYHTYSSASVAEVIEHARLRGIRVIPEIGTPRHTYSIGRSHPELIIRCNGSKRADDILNPATNKTYAFLENLYTEISEVFRDKYIHIGMNDFDMSCWKTNEAVSNYMKKSGLVLMSQMARYYVTRIQKLIEKTAKNAIVWEDPLDIGVKMHRRTVIVQVYKNWKRDPIGTVVRQEYRVIDSTCWNTSSVPSPDAWKTDYLCDPHKFPGSILDYDLVVGGEMLHWGMQIGSSNFFGSLWPRAAAVAERLWSTKSTRDLDDAIFRLEEQRCRMIMLGIPSSPVIPGYCREEYDGYFRPSSSASKYTSSAAMMYIALACIFDLLSQFFTGHDYGEYPHSAEPS